MGDTNKEYANFLKDKYGEIMVVLHRYDFANAETRKSYESIGHSITTHGVGTPWEKDFDPLFLKKQRDLVSGCSTVVSNSMSSAVLYATSLGLEPEIGGPISYSITNIDDKASQVGDGSIYLNTIIMEPDNQINLWKTLLGLACIRSPQDL